MKKRQNYKGTFPPDVKSKNQEASALQKKIRR